MNSLISTLFLFSKIKVIVFDFVRGLYYDSIVFRSICDDFTQMIYIGDFYIKTYIYHQKCEPFGSWLYTFRYLKNDLKLSFEEKYSDLSCHEEVGVIRIPTETANNKNILKIIKTPMPSNDTFYITFTEKHMDAFSLDTIQLSTISFLSVEYTHPSMKHGIFISMPKGYFVVGNEILGPSFIYRCLLYQSSPFVFDENYKVLIIDNDISIVKLVYPQYISISETSYQIKNPVKNVSFSDLPELNEIGKTENQETDWDQWEEKVSK